jgi:aldose 1-epimerase
LVLPYKQDRIVDHKMPMTTRGQALKPLDPLFATNKGRSSMSQPDQKIIHLRAGEFHADIAPKGANLVRFRLGERDLILGLADRSAHVTNDFYAGAIVGPVANRVSQGRVEIGDALFQMERNEAGVTALHSGSDGLHRMLWEVQETTASQAVLRCALPDGHSGLPGNREITVTFTLEPTGLSVTITAHSDRKTPMNIAHHPYWALEPDQSKTELYIDAPDYLEIDPTGIPTGRRIPVQDGPFDFTTSKPIGLAATLDHNWCLSTEKTAQPRRVATVMASDGLRLDIETTEVGLQVYTGSGLPTFAPSASVGPQIKPNAGIALEPQGWPDAPNQPEFPNIMLERGETYRQITRYILSKT